ncbi:MAG: D-alanine--D-alanine ligase [Deltaproteobacteria bacterium]|jgi:D-alanine-D-alanine ligase|nr:D-alanine--D-alanine ligase [Deltaproteobacteria bacterium]
MAALRLALIMGGRSEEREVSLASGREVLSNLDKSRYKVTIYDPVYDLERLIRDADNLDLAFPVLHGLHGEDGSIQGLMKLLNIPCVGSGILASAMAMDKEKSKGIFREHGIPVAKDLILIKKAGLKSESARAAKTLSLPVVIKPIEQGSSVGLSIANSSEELEVALEDAWTFAPKAMAEEYISGREFTVAVIGNDNLTALPPIEIIPAPGHLFFDYSAKYDPGEAQEICPADLSDEETQTICDLGTKAHMVLGCRGYSRSDFILRDNVFYALETNTLPGLTSGSLFPKAAKAAGYSFSAILDRLVDLALEH